MVVIGEVSIFGCHSYKTLRSTASDSHSDFDGIELTSGIPAAST